MAKSETARRRDFRVSDLVLKLFAAGPCIPARDAPPEQQEKAEIDHRRAWTLVLWKAMDVEALARLTKSARDGYGAISQRVMEAGGIHQATESDDGAMIDLMLDLRALLGATLEAQSEMLDLLIAGVVTTLGRPTGSKAKGVSIAKRLTPYATALGVKPPPPGLVALKRSLDDRTEARNQYQTHPQAGDGLWPDLGVTTDLRRLRLFPEDPNPPGDPNATNVGIAQLVDDTFDYIGQLTGWLIEVLESRGPLPAEPSTH